MFSIQAQGISKLTGNVWALSEVSFAFSDIELLYLIGENGAGKSTLLNCLSGLLRADSGDITVSLDTKSFIFSFSNGENDFRKTRYRQATSYFSHSLKLYADLTVQENLELFGALHGNKSGAGKIIDDFELKAVVSQKVKHCSFGVQKRTALARTFLGNPRLIFFDEPFFGLDAPSRAKLQAIIREHKKAGVSFIISTHEADLNSLGEAAILKLQKGRSVQ